MEFNGGTIVLICSFVLFPLGFFWRRLRSRGPSTPLRGPTSPSFLYGHALVLDSAEDPALVYEQWAEAYGSAFLVSVPLGKTRIVLTDPKAIAHFYSRVAYGYGRTRQQRMNVELLVSLDADPRALARVADQRFKGGKGHIMGRRRRAHKVGGLCIRRPEHHF